MDFSFTPKEEQFQKNNFATLNTLTREQRNEVERDQYSIYPIGVPGRKVVRRMDGEMAWYRMQSLRPLAL